MLCEDRLFVHSINQRFLLHKNILSIFYFINFKQGLKNFSLTIYLHPVVVSVVMANARFHIDATKKMKQKKQVFRRIERSRDTARGRLSSERRTNTIYELYNVVGVLSATSCQRVLL